MVSKREKTSSGIGSIFNDVLRFKDAYRDQVVVIKLGGARVEDTETVRSIGRQAAFLSTGIGARVVVVHGGGPQIDAALAAAGIEAVRDQKTGYRITDADTLEISDKALRHLNGKIVRTFNEVSPDCRAIGMAGYDGLVVQGAPVGQDTYTGEVQRVDTACLDALFAAKAVPVIYPISAAEKPQQGETRLNINADNVAAAIAEKLGAKRLILCTDAPGVQDKEGTVLTGLTQRDIDQLIDDGTITGGMTAKVRAAARAAERLPGGGVVILDGRQDNAILTELLYEKGAGTLIRASRARHDSLRPPAR